MENLRVWERREGWNDRAAESRPNIVSDLCVSEGGRGGERER